MGLTGAEGPGSRGRPGTGVPSGTPRPLTPERLAERLRSVGHHFFVDSEGDVGGIWHGRLFHLFLIGEEQQVFQVRGRWNRRLSIERLGEALELCDRWNRDLLWPKCYVRVQDDGYVHVVTEISTPFAAGATDAQLTTCIQNGLAYSGAVFDALDRQYPDPAESGP
jgi:hypothetical protein